MRKRSKPRLIVRSGRKPVTAKMRPAIWAKTNGRCWYCGRSVDVAIDSYLIRSRIDHQDPFARGGDDTIDNLVLACFHCNAQKACHTVEEYRASIGWLMASSLGAIITHMVESQEAVGLEHLYGAITTNKAFCALASEAKLRFYGERIASEPPLDYQI